MPDSLEANQEALAAGEDPARNGKNGALILPQCQAGFSTKNLEKRICVGKAPGSAECIAESATDPPMAAYLKY